MNSNNESQQETKGQEQEQETKHREEVIREVFPNITSITSDNQQTTALTREGASITVAGNPNPALLRMLMNVAEASRNNNR